jgi:ADP-heptose:LPS heptosyltransferase
VTVRHILVVELLGGLGDLLLALPAIHALARSHPTARLTVLTFEPGARLLERDPHVDEVVATTDHSPGAARSLVDQVLARGRWDVVVTTTTYDGIAVACRRNARCAVTDLWEGAPDGDLVDVRFLRILARRGLIGAEHAGTPLRVHVAPAERTGGAARLTEAGLGLGGVLAVPGSGMAVKRWPRRRWEQLLARLDDQGVAVAAIGDGSPPGVPSLDPTDLRGLVGSLAALADARGVVVGGDTGPVRLATAVGAAAVGLYGPTSAGRYGLRGGARSLQGLPGCPVRRPSSIAEQECWWHARCPLAEAPACMADLSVDAVLDAVSPLLPDRQSR